MSSFIILIFVSIFCRTQARMKEATHGSALSRSRHAKTFAIRPIGLLAHVLAFAKVIDLFKQA